MTYIQAFDKIKEKLDGKAEISQDYDSFAIQVTLTNKDSHGIFYLKYSDGFLDVQPYDYFDNDAAVSLSYQTFLKLTDGRLSLDDALSKGLAEIYGNRSAAAAICGIVPQDKPQVKKATPKTPKETKPTAKAKKSEPKAETKTQKMAKTSETSETSETSASAKSTEVKTPSKAVKPLASTAEKKKNVPSGSVKASAASKAKATRNATDKKSEKPVSKSKK